jgi:signal transduction histidine kinase
MIVSRLRSGERLEHFETIRQAKDGRQIDVSLTISPIRDNQGNIIGASKISRDISEQKRDEQRKNDFIGMVSHELKTPLTSLTAILQVLQAKMSKSEETFIPGALERANVQVKKMAKLINGFLNVSRLESGKFMIVKEKFKLDELLDEIISETELTLAQHVIHFDNCDSVQVYADRDKIGSVVSNLMSNAIKYSPGSGIVDVRCRVEGRRAIVSIQDYGMGVKRHEREKLFDRYYRVQGGSANLISGFGIGLYLSAEIIRHHDGEIWVESEYGHGSTFYFSLPLDAG